jgi:hypothetical protein
MKDETRAAFEQALAGYEARTKAAADAKDEKLAQRRRFEVEFRRLRDKVIIPALKQIAEELLEPRGWKCNLRYLEQTIEATLEIYRGDVKTVSSGERSFISFKAEAHSPEFTVYTSAQSQGGPQCTRPLEEVSGDFVQQQVLEFFQLLASGRR